MNTVWLRIVTDQGLEGWGEAFGHASSATTMATLNTQLASWTHLRHDTLLYVIIGDNGASAEGSLQGTFNEMITLGGFGALETPEFMTSHIDDFEFLNCGVQVGAQGCA